jgi:hypothetical protein
VSVCTIGRIAQTAGDGCVDASTWSWGGLKAGRKWDADAGRGAPFFCLRFFGCESMSSGAPRRKNRRAARAHPATRLKSGGAWAMSAVSALQPTHHVSRSRSGRTRTQTGREGTRNATRQRRTSRALAPLAAEKQKTRGRALGRPAVSTPSPDRGPARVSGLAGGGVANWEAGDGEADARPHCPPFRVDADVPCRLALALASARSLSLRSLSFFNLP